MWHFIQAELRYQKGRAARFFAGAVAVAALLTTVLDIDDPKGFFFYPSFLLLAGLLLHVATLWDSENEKRSHLHTRLRQSRRAAAGAQVLAPVAFQLLGFSAAMLGWGGLFVGGRLDPGVAAEAAWFLVAANGAGLAFLLGWAHLAPEVEAWKERDPRLAWTVSGLAVVVSLSAAAWALSPAPLASAISLTYPAASAIFYPLAVVLAGLKCWLYTHRDVLGA